MASGPARYTHVDLLRGLAAIVVLICHYKWFYSIEPGVAVQPNNLPLYGLLWPFYDHGALPVYVFWQLSGFVFWQAYGRGNFSARSFWLNRFARLYPLHFVTLIAVAGLQAWRLKQTGDWTVYGNNDLIHFVAQLGLASNWFSMDASYNGPIWSVSVEVLIYFLFVGFMLRPSALLAIATAAVGFAAYRATQSEVALCMTMFFLGVAMAIVTPLLHERIPRKLGGFAGGALAASIGVAAFLIQSGYFADFILTFTVIPTLLFAVAVMDRTRQPIAKRWHWIGAITYAVYLLHMPTLIALRLATHDQLPLESPLMLFVFATLVIGLSALTYRYFEMPAQSYLRHRFASGVAVPKIAERHSL